LHSNIKGNTLSTVDFILCPNIEGLLKKKNSHGEWKDRYCTFQNSFFMTYKPKGNNPSTELKESIDLKDAENIYVKDDTIHLELKNGELLLYKGSRTNEWINPLKSRSAKAQEIYTKALADSTGVHITGWLRKKSHNKFQGFQVRHL
jgi:hypothetical protein